MSSDPFGVCLSEICEDELKMPSVKDMAKSFIDSAKDVVAGAISGENILVSDDVRESRLEICRSCEFFEKVKSRCSKCGCFMEIKTKFANVQCPIDKWS
jgi:Family of unknown function (DUF6171)